MDVFSGITLTKQAYDLLKVIKDGRDQALVKQAAGELYEKITELQMLNAELAASFALEQEKVKQAEGELAKLKAFKSQAENYSLFTTEGEATIYRSNQPAGQNNVHHFLCPNCFHNSVFAMLQPGTKNSASGGFFVSYCPVCQNEFRMAKIPRRPPVSVPSSSGW
ncbi:TPA: hypothetical protein OND30_004488 [Enterobacter kobei]|nr:hypothetical protein [Enterobacter kobei]